MLSLPLIPPQDDHPVFLRNVYRPRAESPPPQNVPQNQQTHRERQRRDEERKQHHAQSPLAVLAAEEAAIEHRKSQVRNFGAHWIRPPGVPKTLQAMMEEELERQEQAEIDRQERGMLDLEAQQQLEDVQRRAAETAAAAETADGEEEGEEERDLDDEIPDADVTAADVTFNEESMLEGSQIDMEQGEDMDADLDAELEEAELTGAARDGEDLGMELELEVERDLDDSVPEAGSYQHTDSEVEDSDSESELRSSWIGRSARQAARTPADPSSVVMGTPAGDQSMMAAPATMAGLQERMRAQVSAADSLPRSPGSLNLSSSILDSSMVNSSPVMQRSNAGGRGRGQRGRRGRMS